MDEIILPKIENFSPDIILLSAGFDAHKNDPLANLNWLSEDYYKITQKMCFVAEKLCKKRMVSSLEGGYNLSALGESVAFHVKALMEG
jgi:acetoin utilization deacetylase AcuC-like enzyme